MKQAHLNIYGYIGDGEQDVSPQKVLAFIASLSEDVTDIVVHINSYGGSVFAGFNIHEQLVMSGKKITTIAEGICASIATVIFLAGSTRKVTENSEFMFHAPMVSFGFDEHLNADELQTIQQDLKDEENRMADFYQKKLGIEMNKVQELLSKDSWIKPDEAIELKIATEKTSAMKAVAHYSTKKQQMTFIEKMKAALKVFTAEEAITPTVANAKTTDGATIYFDGSLSEGTKVYSDEAMSTPMADGNYTLESGKTITVASGAVTSISDADMSASVEEQIAELKKSNDALKAKVDELTAAKAESEAEAEKTVKELTARLSKVVSSGYKPKESQTQFRTEDQPVKLSAAEMTAKIKEKRAAKAKTIAESKNK